MVKARKAGVSTPCLYLIDSSNSKIYMERIDGVTAKQFILDCMESKSPPPFATPVTCMQHVVLILASLLYEWISCL